MSMVRRSLLSARGAQRRYCKRMARGRERTRQLALDLIHLHRGLRDTARDASVRCYSQCPRCACLTRDSQCPRCACLTNTTHSQRLSSPSTPEQQIGWHGVRKMSLLCTSGAQEGVIGGHRMTALSVYVVSETFRGVWTESTPPVG